MLRVPREDEDEGERPQPGFGVCLWASAGSLGPGVRSTSGVAGAGPGPPRGSEVSPAALHPVNLPQLLGWLRAAPGLPCSGGRGRPARSRPLGGADRVPSPPLGSRSILSPSGARRLRSAVSAPLRERKNEIRKCESAEPPEPSGVRRGEPGGGLRSSLAAPGAARAPPAGPASGPGAAAATLGVRPRRAFECDSVQAEGRSLTLGSRDS